MIFSFYLLNRKGFKEMLETYPCDSKTSQFGKGAGEFGPKF